MTKRITGSIAATAAVLAALTACSTDSADTADAPSDGPVTIGVVSGSASNPAVQVMDQGIEDEAEASDVEVYVETSESVDEQIQKADALIARGVDYLALHPWDGEAVIPLIESASSQGVKVIILVDGVPGVVEDGDALTFVSGNEVEAAQAIGTMVAESATGPEQAALLTGTPGNLSAENRAKGFTDGIAGSQVEIVAQSTANWARDEALQVAGDIITANPDLDVIFAGNDEMALGAVAALQEAGKAGQVDVIGWNGTCVGLAGLLDGDLLALAALPFDEFGRTAVQVAVADSQGEDVDPRVEPDVPILTADTARAILDGSAEGSESLKADLTTAQAGGC